MLRNYLIGLFTVDLNIFIPETQITSDNPQTLYYHAGQGVPGLRVASYLALTYSAEQAR